MIKGIFEPVRLTVLTDTSLAALAARLITPCRPFCAATVTFKPFKSAAF